MSAAPAPRGLRLWVLGARPRTLGAAVVPVLVGTAAATHATVPRFVGCLMVALGLQIAVNFANDYFDGRKGVDTAARVGPVRLTASGLAAPSTVFAAALIALVIGSAAGVVLAVVVDLRLLLVGVLAALAALLYSGGPRPYASGGLGELFVFVFFGPVATVGTTYVQAESVRAEAWWAAVPVGLLAVAILIANNLRDIATDAVAGKRTLAVRIGDARTRMLYRAVVSVALAIPVAGWLLGGLPDGSLLALTAAPMAVGPLRSVGDAQGFELVRILVNTALLHGQFGVMLALGLWLS